MSPKLKYLPESRGALALACLNELLSAWSVVDRRLTTAAAAWRDLPPEDRVAVADVSAFLADALIRIEHYDAEGRL